MLGAGHSHTQSVAWARTCSAPGSRSWRPDGWGVGRPGPALTEHTAHEEMQTNKRTIATICTAGPETATLGAPDPKIQAWDGITESVRSRLNPEGRKFTEKVKNRVRSAKNATPELGPALHSGQVAPDSPRHPSPPPSVSVLTLGESRQGARNGEK